MGRLLIGLGASPKPPPISLGPQGVKELQIICLSLLSLLSNSFTILTNMLSVIILEFRQEITMCVCKCLHFVYNLFSPIWISFWTIICTPNIFIAILNWRWSRYEVLCVFEMGHCWHTRTYHSLPYYSCITLYHNIHAYSKFTEHLQCAKYWFKWFTYNKYYYPCFGDEKSKAQNPVTSLTCRPRSHD